MTGAEAIDVLMLLRAGLPNAYLKLSEADTDAMVALWAEMFREYPADDVVAAAKTYIWRDTNGRFPSPGSIRQIIDSIQEATKGYSFGSEYLTDAKQYPPVVRDYIAARGREIYEESTGLPFRPYIERLVEKSRHMLTEEAGG